MHDDWCFRIAVYGGAQSSGINTYWERVLCIVTDTLVPDARSWMQRAQKKLKISCSARLKQLIIFCCTMLCISAGQNQLPHVTILLSDWLRKRNKPSELTCLSGAVVDADGDGQEFDPLFSSHQDETKVCSEDVFFPRPILLAVRRWWGQPGISGIPKQSQGRSYLLFWRRAFVEESGVGAGGGRTIQTDWIGRSFPTVLHSCILMAWFYFKIKGCGDIKIAMNTVRPRESDIIR